MDLFCDKIIEAGWLTAAIVTPLFFNWYSNRVFDGSKVTLLCSITVLMLAAWLIKVLEAGVGSGKWVLRSPLVIPTLILAGVYILTTITSVAPRISFWGSYQRRQGLYVGLSYIAIFFLMLATLRTRQQLERLIRVILLTSLPISLYGIMQHYRVDPLVWIRGGEQRVESTLGNPILLGAYLIMVVPLTVWQLIRSFSPPPFPPKLGGLRGEEKKVGPSLVLFGCYLLLLVLQLMCLVFTESRGPEMGFLAGALFFLLLWAVLGRRRGLAIAVVGISIALLAILAILNLPNSPLTLPKGTPYVGRLAAISSDIMQDRSLIWQGTVNMITVDKMRAIIGYGPETMGLTFYTYIVPEWAAMMGYNKTADRCHNETLDALVTGGLIGLAAHIILFSSIFYYGLKWLGLIANSRQRNFLIVTGLGGMSLGVLLPWLVEGTFRWAGVGIPAGMLLALVIYLMTALFHQSPKSKVQLPTLQLDSGQASNFQILLITLLSALVAHFVEIQSGIAVTATRTYFWIYAALLVIVGYQWQKEPVTEAAETLPPDSARQQRGRRRRGRGKLPTSNSKLPNLEVLAHSLLVGLIMATTGFDLITHQFDLRANGPVIFGLLFAIWLLGGIPILISDFRFPISDFLTYALGSLLCFLPLIAAHSFIVLPGAGVERATVVFYVYILSVILAIAVVLMMGSVQSSKLKAQSPNFRHRALSFGVCILGFWLIFNTNLKAAQADIYYKFALSSEETGETDKAIALYRHAIQLAPHWDQYYASLGWAYGLKATTTSDASQRATLFEESLKTLDHARQMSPLDPDIAAKLGYVYWNWGGLASDPGERAEKWEAALAHYQRAVTLSPVNHGRLLKDNIVRAHLYLGATYATMGELSQAVEAYQKANEMAPDSYEGHKGLVSVYRQLGRLDEALEEAKTARDLAPEKERPGLDNLIAQLEAQKSW